MPPRVGKKGGDSPPAGEKRKGKGRAFDAASTIATQIAAKEIQYILATKGVSMAAVNKEVRRIEREKAVSRKKTNKAVAVVMRSIERRGLLTSEFAGILVAELTKKVGVILGTSEDADAGGDHGKEGGSSEAFDPDTDDPGTRAPPRMLSEEELVARNALVVKNQPLVRFAIKKFFSYVLVRGSVQFDDMVGYGTFGLIKAAERHDPLKAKFSTYALWWIRQSIDRGIKDCEYTIRVPINRIDEYRREEKESKEAAISASLNGDEESVCLVSGLDKFKTVSLNGSINGRDDASELGEFIPSPLPSPEKNVILLQRERRRKDLISLLEKRLSIDEWHVLKRRFGIEDDTPQTLEEVGAELGVTRERVRQIEMKALACARKMLKKKRDVL